MSSEPSNTPIVRLWTAPGFFGLRLGRRYFKLRDTERHPLMFSERKGHSYRRVMRVRSWEFGIRNGCDVSSDQSTPSRPHIIRNAAECARCGDVIESKHVHDYVSCKCGAIFVDGGHHYIRRGAKDLTDIIDRSEVVER